MTIRRGTPADAAALSALALRSKAHWGYSSDFLAACEAELTVGPEDFRHTEFVVMEDAGADVDAHRIVGFYALRWLSETVPASGPRGMELDALFVEPDAIGNGFGRALLEDARARAAMYGAIVMTVQADPHAEAFYRAAGGRRIGRRESESIPGRFLPVLELALGAAK